MAEEEARDTAGELQEERRRAEGKGGRLSNEERAAAEREIAEASARAGEEAGAQWDAWFMGACEAVDNLLGGAVQEPERETSRGDANDAGATGDASTETPQPSTVSTCQLHPPVRRPDTGASPPLRTM
jgi:membrane protein involved in colicin uptake